MSRRRQAVQRIHHLSRISPNPYFPILRYVGIRIISQPKATSSLPMRHRTQTLIVSVEAPATLSSFLLRHPRTSPTARLRTCAKSTNDAQYEPWHPVGRSPTALRTIVPITQGRARKCICADAPNRAPCRASHVAAITLRGNARIIQTVRIIELRDHLQCALCASSAAGPAYRSTVNRTRPRVTRPSFVAGRPGPPNPVDRRLRSWTRECERARLEVLPSRVHSRWSARCRDARAGGCRRRPRRLLRPPPVAPLRDVSGALPPIRRVDTSVSFSPVEHGRRNPTGFAKSEAGPTRPACSLFPYENKDGYALLEPAWSTRPGA